MEIWLREKIGNPDIFTGRRKELSHFLKWMEGVKQETSMSTAILSRRKNGKTALLRRLYNIVFHKNNGLVPFYFEARPGKTWAMDFCQEFLAAFAHQFIAYKTRNREYLLPPANITFDRMGEMAREEGFEFLSDLIGEIRDVASEDRPGLVWDLVRDAPRYVAEAAGEPVVQIIDEFQYLNTEIYWDREKKNFADDFAAGYMYTAEYKNAPLLITGSWIGWFQNMLLTRFPSRFRLYFMEYLPEDECVEMIYNHSRLFDISVSEETVYLMAKLCGGSPFYVTALFQSRSAEHNLAHHGGLLKVIEFETLNRQGLIKNAWMENILKDPTVSTDRNSKKIVLHLSKHRDRQVSRKKLLSDLNLDIAEAQLEERLKSLLLSDLIEQGGTNSDYQGVRDHIFDKVFRGMYQKDIQMYNESEVSGDYGAFLESEKAKFDEAMGELGYASGYYAEYLIIGKLRDSSPGDRKSLKTITENLPNDFKFARYESVRPYRYSPLHLRNVDIHFFAKAGEHDYSLIGEVKRRDTRKFSLGEAVVFSKKVDTLKKIEPVNRVAPFVFSLSGFTQEALEYFKEQNIAWSDNSGWLE